MARRRRIEPVEPWTTGKRVNLVVDEEHGLAFIRKPGEMWDAYTVEGMTLRRFYVTSFTDLSRARHETLKAIGESLAEHARALHPYADRTHAGRWESKVMGWVHLCGVQYTSFKTTATNKLPTCPMCLASIKEDMEAAVKAADAAELAAATEHVRTVRAVNALGQAVNGEDATDKL